MQMEDEEHGIDAAASMQSMLNSNM